MAIKHFCDRCDRELAQQSATTLTLHDNVPLLGFDETDTAGDEAVHSPRSPVGRVEVWGRVSVLCENCVQSFIRWLEAGGLSP